MTTTEEPSRAAVYRLFDETERLLYVGVSNDPRARFKDHERDKPWWPQVTAREIEWHDSRKKALTAEARAIVHEQPLHNDMGVQWPHHRLGEAPAETVQTTYFKMDPQGWMDHVAETQRPVVITRNKVPQVVIVPYFDRPQRDDQDADD